MKSLLSNAKVEVIDTLQAAGTGTTTSDTVDMANYEGGLFLIPVGACAATGTVTAHLEQSSDDASADAYSDLEGTEVTATNCDNTCLVIDLAKASKRYVQLVVVRAADTSELGPLMCLKYNPRCMPVVQAAADVPDSETVAGPAEGTP
jgi:hypothetical protein